MIAKIISVTLNRPPKGETHWSSREVAGRVGVSRSTVLRAWQDHDLQPHRTRSFKFSTDPELEQKVTDVIGLYLHPPEKAVVLCVDEKSRVAWIGAVRKAAEDAGVGWTYWELDQGFGFIKDRRSADGFDTALIDALLPA